MMPYRLTGLASLFVTCLLLAGCGPSTVGQADLIQPAEALLERRRAENDGVLPAIKWEAGDRERLAIEKPNLRFGFIKLTDCAPLVIAKEKGFFEDEGLNVELEPQSNWKVLLDRVIDGQLDGGHMLTGQPIGASIGYGTAAPIITAYSLAYNGNGITLSNDVWARMQEIDPALHSPTPPHPIGAAALKPVIEAYRQEGRDVRLAMVFPVSGHNYELRYWLAAAGIHPGMYSAQNITGTLEADVELSVTPPPQMPATLEAGTILGYCVGEPWNQRAAVDRIGVPVTTNYDIWKNNPEKVFGVHARWDERNPHTHVAVIKALMRAGMWLDATDAEGRLIHRDETAEILSRKDYVGTDVAVLKRSLTGTFAFQENDVREMPDFNVFFKYHASFPHYSDCVWFLTQMRRWGQIDSPRPAAWYDQTAREIYRPDVYRQAAEALIHEGYLSGDAIPPAGYDGYRSPNTDFIDGKRYDGRDPIGYINSFAIGNKDQEEAK